MYISIHKFELHIEIRIYFSAFIYKFRKDISLRFILRAELMPHIYRIHLITSLT